MEIEFIQELVKHAAKQLVRRKLDDFTMSFDKNYKWDEAVKTLPKFNPIYKDAVLQHHKVAVHSELGCFPYEILKSKAPNQSKEEWEYQMGLYESYTNSTWSRAKNKTKIIANDQNYAIEGWDAEQKKYFYEDYPAYHSVLDYFFDIVRDNKIDYPNQVLVIEPRYIPGYYNDEDDFIPDQSELIEPIAKIIIESKIIDYIDNEYLLILEEDDYEYSVAGTEYENGLLFKFYDSEKVVEIRQIGFDNNHIPVFEYVVVYEHNWGWLPARKLQGRPIKNDDGRILYNSHFADAIPDLNDVIRMSATRSMSINKMAYPVIIAVVDPCSYQDQTTGARCNGGRIINSTGGYSTCPSCDGSGKQSNHSPTGVYEVVARTQNGLGDNILPMTPPVQFAAPDSAILEYLGNIIEEKKKSAFGHLFESEDASAATATGKELEKEEFISFLIQFSNEFFALMAFTIEAIGWMRYGTDFIMPSITKPKSFSLKTNADITAEIADAKKNGLPSIYTQRLITESNNTRFNTSPSSEAELEFIYRIDRLWNKDDLTIRSMIGSTATKMDAIIHDSITTFITNALADYPQFWELDYDTQKEIIYTYAGVELDKLVPKSTTGDKILAEGNALSQSVGGLTGMIEIVKAVSEGYYDLEAAVKLISNRFGITEDEARAQLGTPQLGAVVKADIGGSGNFTP